MSLQLLLSSDTTLKCPHCARDFSLESGFAKQALEAVHETSTDSIAALRREERSAGEARAQRENAERLRLMEADLATQQQKLKDIDRREATLRQQQQDMESRVQAAAAQRAAELVAAERGLMQKQLDERAAQVRQLRDEQLAMRDERQKLQDEKDALMLEVRRQVDAGLAEREQKVRAQEQERAALEKAELQKTIADMDKQLNEARRKAAQGSQQLQGEVLENAIEEGLARVFPLDTIEEVKKGVRGGDVIQRVVGRNGQGAGILLWESKRAKDYSAAWIAKLKDDMRAAGAEVGVLVTMPSAVPKDWPAGQQFAMVDGIWVVVWSVALQLADVLRTALLDVAKQRTVSAGKNEKMEAVYDYVTSPQFALKVRAVYDVFTKMRDELEAEKNQALQRWARREKQLQGGMSALLGIGGEIQGLASEELKMLELASGEKDSAQ